ncbi:MAG TPA: hypothetical protein VJX67_06500 [Blastocatellia bacterium]|nr:hypothetical protein [Blastocatellia bacterium]
MKVRLPVAILVLCLGLLYPVQKWMERAAPSEGMADETLYLNSGTTIKRMAPGLDAIVADIYWIRTVQYFGQKLLNAPPAAMETRYVRMDLLGPLLNIIVTLDPNDIPAYRFGALFLPERDPKAAIDLLNRGIRDNPSEWRLYQDLGFIYWHQGNYQKAAEVYDSGSRIEGARWWMRDLAALMKVRGGDRETARAIYLRYAESDDKNVRDQAIRRLEQLESLDEIDAINSLLNQYRNQVGSCPADLRLLAKWIAKAGVKLDGNLQPVDPEGIPYRLVSGECRVELAPTSPVPR